MEKLILIICFTLLVSMTVVALIFVWDAWRDKRDSRFINNCRYMNLDDAPTPKVDRVEDGARLQ